MDNQEWLEQRLQFVKGLKSPNQQQQLLLLLAEKEDRSADDEKKLQLVIKAERAEERAQKAKAELRKITQQEKSKQRKEETRKKILLGASLMTDVKNGLVDWSLCKESLMRNLDKEDERQLFKLEPKQQKEKSAVSDSMSFFSGNNSNQS